MTSGDEKSRLLADWREANWAELDRNLDVAKKIRDDKDAPARVRIDAIREINKLFGVVELANPPAKLKKEEVLVSTEEEKRIQAILHESGQKRTS